MNLRIEFITPCPTDVEENMLVINQHKELLDKFIIEIKSMTQQELDSIFEKTIITKFTIE